MWAPEKCVVLARDDPHLTLHGKSLPHQDSFKCLGVWINANGIDAEKHIEKLCQNALAALAVMHRCGVNKYGANADTLVTAYKSFIQPCMEYGLASSNRRST